MEEEAIAVDVRRRAIQALEDRIRRMNEKLGKAWEAVNDPAGPALIISLDGISFRQKP
jgi:hypothetical protein